MGVRVSVVVPTFDRAHVLPRAIASIQKQTFTDWEILVVDDASTDDSVTVLEAMGEPRLRILCHQERRGGAAARNTGIRAAKGDWIAFQDSDDAWRPRHLERSLAAVEGRDEQMVYGAFARHMGRRVLRRPRRRERNISGQMLPSILSSNPVTTAAAVVRRDLLDRIGSFDEQMPRFHDWELWIRVAQETEFAHVAKVGMDQYPQPDSISKDIEATVAAHERILAQHAPLFEAHPSEHAQRLAQLGAAQMRAGRTADARRSFLAAMGLAPTDRKLRKQVKQWHP